MRAKFVIGMLFGLTAASGAWAQSPAPSGRWDLRHEGESCYLTRSFPNGSDSMELRIQSFGSATPYHFVFIGNGLPIRKDRAVLMRVGFGGEAEAQDAIALAGRSGSLPAVVLAVGQPHRMNMLAWYYSYRNTYATMVPPFDPSAKELFVDFADTQPLTLALGPMLDEYARLDECAKAIVAKASAASSPGGYPSIAPELLQPKTTDFRVKYPVNLLLNRVSGLVELRMIVDEKGRARDCVVQKAIWARQFGDDACHALQEWARFEPARDSSGKAVPAVYRTAVMYVIYNW